ncbi:phosphatase PAP2 family protein [Vibrio hangzhouensis]|uniref:undecaprenyl-diphosphate phosphatase n=1 Tax=Vibrio hangzhouensis TaxID=462991 RepID=A0A1H5UAE8_9VIBR|nr:phosphatase PAP2 family protein [Vibrio hangzhouensis]SEF72026.1 undecaprenyl-diphosphatase [Vibrio hangzhouensis]
MRTIESIVRMDLAFSLFCLSHRFNLQVATISRWVSRTGDGHLYLLLTLGTWLLERESGSQFMSAALLAFAIELPVYWLTKNSFKRRRPREFSQLLQAYITPSDRYSLPSGHTAAAFLMATIIGHFYPAWFEISLLWAVFIGTSRILLGVHFLTDVVIGALLGFAAAQLALSHVLEFI